MNDNLKTNIEEQLHAEMQRLKKAIEYIEQANLNLKKQDELYQVVVASNQEYKEKIINLEKTLNSLFENTKKEEILAISEVVKKEYNDQTKLNLERYEELFQLAAAENKEYKGKIIDLENTLNGIIQNIDSVKKW